jgi:hypothetical protein
LIIWQQFGLHFQKLGNFFFQISGHSGLGLIMLSVIKLSVVW